ncbi:MAG TPA: M23 family metallopeptidase [Caulobacteraceae bacterium]
MKRYRFAILAGLGSAFASLAPAAQAQPAARLEVRFCPAAQVRTYPLESRRGVQSLLLQNVVVINRGDAAADLSAVEFDLMQGGEVADARRITGPALASVGASGPKLQASGMLRLVAFQFCGEALVPSGVTLTAGPTIKPSEGLLIAQQPFAFKGSRDQVRVRFEAHAPGHDIQATGALPIVTGVSKTVFRFPLGPGRWFAAVGPTMHTGHRWGLPEEFAFDIASLGDGNLSHRGSGERFTDYYVYGAPVLAAASGKVVAASGAAPEDPAELRRPGESEDDYGGRIAAAQQALLTQGDTAVAGNFVLIDHGAGEYSLYAHMQPGSITVRPGDAVTAGQPIGRVGSSGNSTEPHLHFQVCDAPRILSCAGIPINFSNITLPFADYPRAPQSGDVVEVR